MKIKFLKAMMAVVILASMSSCATLFGGPITAYQKTKPAPGKPERELRAGALILDIVQRNTQCIYIYRYCSFLASRHR